MARDGGGEVAGCRSRDRFPGLRATTFLAFSLTTFARENDQQSPTHARATSHPREASTCWCCTRACANTYTYTRVDLHVVHTGRLRVDLTTGVDSRSSISKRSAFCSRFFFSFSDFVQIFFGGGGEGGGVYSLLDEYAWIRWNAACGEMYCGMGMRLGLVITDEMAGHED